MKRVLHQIMTATPTEKMGVMATDGDVCTKGSFTPNDFTTVTVTLIFLTALWQAEKVLHTYYAHQRNVVAWCERTLRRQSKT